MKLFQKMWQKIAEMAIKKIDSHDKAEKKSKHRRQREILPKSKWTRAMRAIGDLSKGAGGFPDKVPDDMKEHLDAMWELFDKNIFYESDIILFCACTRVIGHRDEDGNPMNLIEFAKCDYTALAEMFDRTEELKLHGYLQQERGSFDVEIEALVAISNGRRPESPRANLSHTKFLYTIGVLAGGPGRHPALGINVASHTEVQKAFFNLMRLNPDLEIVKTLRMWYDFKKPDDESFNYVAMILYLCAGHIKNGVLDFQASRRALEEVIPESFLGHFQIGYDRFTTEGNPHLKSVPVKDQNMSTGTETAEYCLTDFAKNALISEDIKQFGEFTIGSLKKSKDFFEKSLYYSKSNQKSIDELSELLSEEKFDGICKRLKLKGQRTGFCCLFYGAPGTGKTETVYQIAKRTGRDLMIVDMGSMRDMWYGNTEKNIKKKFDDYRYAVEHMKKAPILMFNEADALFGQRLENKQQSIDTTENAIQNLLLQGMEDLDGILIATTNLEKNLDAAFERRFLYKICFDKPSVEARQHIWSSMIPTLPDEQVNRVASRYELTGGQIENISRKSEINYILHGDLNFSEKELDELCESELGKKGRVMGFN